RFRIDTARYADANTLKRLVHVPLAQHQHSFNDALESEVRIGNRHDRFARKHAAGKVDDCEDRAVRADVQSECHDLFVNLQHRRGAAARTTNDGTFAYPAFADQMFDDDRYRARLQTGEAGKLHAGEWLPEADNF